MLYWELCSHYNALTGERRKRSYHDDSNLDTIKHSLG
jgi:hypothetical protein